MKILVIILAVALGGCEYSKPKIAEVSYFYPYQKVFYADGTESYWKPASITFKSK